jgi:transcriptional regulator GlxA family with amidase domain
LAQCSLANATGMVDTLVVAGGLGTRPGVLDPKLVPWLRRTARRARRIASVCTGAFLLAEAGLLDGRRATTHWEFCGALQRRFPAVRVERDPIFVRDEHVFTSAGITAGMDLALELVEDDFGRDLALTVARWLVMFLRRPGGQSVQLAVQLAERNGLREIQGWIADHPDGDCSVAALARRARMSPRNFARAFRREIGVTPAGYLEAQRVEAGAPPARNQRSQHRRGRRRLRIRPRRDDAPRLPSPVAGRARPVPPSLPGRAPRPGHGLLRGRREYPTHGQPHRKPATRRCWSRLRREAGSWGSR